MRVLIICYCYPPDPGPRAYRWSAIAECWAAQGHQVHVISARKQGAIPEEILNGVHVRRVGGAISENLRLWLERSDKNTTKTAVQNAPDGALITGPGRLLKIIHDLTWKQVYWPDSACLWFFPARSKALNLCRKILFDGVISTSTPYTGHLIGKAVKTAHPHIPWIVDIGDPFSFGQPALNNIRLFESLNYRSEAEVLKLANGISMTVESSKKAYTNIFPGIADKITIIPPLFSGTLDAPPAKPPASKRQRLVFAGSLYRDIRNPAYLLKLLSGLFEKMPDLHVHFYGRINDCADLFEMPLRKFSDNLFIHGLVTRESAADAMKQADALINIANQTSHQLPSKLVDYMATGKPIINIVSIDDDSSLLFLRPYPQTITFMDYADACINDDVEKLSDFISNAKMVPQKTVIKLIHPFQINAVESQYRNLFTLENDK